MFEFSPTSLKLHGRKLNNNQPPEPPSSSCSHAEWLEWNDWRLPAGRSESPRVSLAPFTTRERVASPSLPHLFFEFRLLKIQILCNGRMAIRPGPHLPAFEEK
jgi:hypothetical protein